MKKEQTVPRSIYPRPLIEREEVRGVLGGFEQTARDLLHVHLDNRNYLIPTTCRKFLEEHGGQHIAITTIQGKHYTRVMKVAPSEKDLLRAKVAELEGRAMHSVRWKRARRATAQRREIIRRWRQAVILSQLLF